MKYFIRSGMIAVVLILTVLNFTVYGETLFPKTSMVSQKCSVCHKPLADGSLEVIEETRKTPEEWKAAVDRMIRLNGALLDDANFDAVIKELSRDLCLSPGEMARIAYINSDENSQYREIPKTDLENRLFAACVRCHTWGKMASHRMTKAQWVENRNLHLGYYPTSVHQMREMDWIKESLDLVEPLAKLYIFENGNIGKECRMKKKGLKPINKRAKKLEDKDVFGMGDNVMASMPIGCTTIFDTGWETNPRPETPMSNCISSARDFTSCSGPCWWPAQTPDNITNYPDFQNQCQAIEKDWRNLNFVTKR